jgi:uncharacterized tellurite resistance protein B-like protein
MTKRRTTFLEMDMEFRHLMNKDRRWEEQEREKVVNLFRELAGIQTTDIETLIVEAKRIKDALIEENAQYSAKGLHRNPLSGANDLEKAAINFCKWHR